MVFSSPVSTKPGERFGTGCKLAGARHGLSPCSVGLFSQIQLYKYVRKNAVKHGQICRKVRHFLRMQFNCMNWNDLRYVLEVAHNGRLPCAAKRLGVNRTTSRKLSDNARVTFRDLDQMIQYPVTD